MKTNPIILAASPILALLATPALAGVNSYKLNDVIQISKLDAKFSATVANSESSTSTIDIGLSPVSYNATTSEGKQFLPNGTTTNSALADMTSYVRTTYCGHPFKPTKIVFSYDHGAVVSFPLSSTQPLSGAQSLQYHYSYINSDHPNLGHTAIGLMDCAASN